MLRAVLFDWDGTLADTAEASYRCYEKLFTELAVPFDRDTYARTYSPNWYLTFKALDIPEHLWPHADSRWLAHFAEEPVAMIAGARELLENLARREIVAGIVTSGGRERVSAEIGAHGLESFFAACVFGSDVSEKKPHPAALHLCLERIAVHAAEALYVGDSPEDILMARAAGVRAVAIPGKYPNHAALLASQPDEVITSLSELAELVCSRTRSTRS